MDKNENNGAKFAAALGTIGLIAGVFLIFSGDTFIGIAGSVASAGIAYKGFNDLKKR